MSNLQNAKLYDLFLSEFTEVFVCPYCGDALSIDQNACCGEAGHGETMWDDGHDYYNQKQLKKMFQVWLAKHEGSETIAREYDYEQD